MMRPKLVEIARRLNTTAPTVSKVINGRPGVSPQLRALVNKELTRLHYSKRPVRHPKSRTIMLVCSDLTQPWVPDLLKGAFRYATLRSMSVAITGRNVGENAYIGAIERAHPASVLFDSPYIPMNDRRVCDRFNIIYSSLSLDGEPAQDATEYRIDDWRTGFEAGKYLLHLGHHRFAVLSASLSVPCNQARVSGFQAALRKANVFIPSHLIYETHGWMESGRHVGLSLLSRPASFRPTAVFLTSDTLAIGFLSAAHELHIHVPEQLSLLSCDDIQLGWHTDPPLTTFHHPIVQMVFDAFASMTSNDFELNKRGKQTVHTYQSQLIVRKSCSTV